MSGGVQTDESDRAAAMRTDLLGSAAGGPPSHRSGSADYRQMTDTELVAAVDSDLEAFGELIRRHQDFVYGAALRVVRNPVLAQDVAQDTFVRTYKALADFRGQAAVRSWLYRIATNLALNAVQRRKEYPAEELPETVTSSGPEKETVRGAMAAHMRSAIEELPTDLKRPLVLREYDCLSYQEISEALDLPLNTVRTRILRARRALRTAMEEWQ
jgi:RNA polymerase sigma-70 factor (ECF subfamily)